jgi:hypothetical protein
VRSKSGADGAAHLFARALGHRLEVLLVVVDFRLACAAMRGLGRAIVLAGLGDAKALDVGIFCLRGVHAGGSEAGEGDSNEGLAGGLGVHFLLRKKTK